MRRAPHSLSVNGVDKTFSYVLSSIPCCSFCSVNLRHIKNQHCGIWWLVVLKARCCEVGCNFCNFSEGGDSCVAHFILLQTLMLTDCGKKMVVSEANGGICILVGKYHTRLGENWFFKGSINYFNYDNILWFSKAQPYVTKHYGYFMELIRIIKSRRTLGTRRWGRVDFHYSDSKMLRWTVWGKTLALGLRRILCRVHLLSNNLYSWPSGVFSYEAEIVEHRSKWSYSSHPLVLLSVTVTAQSAP